MVQLVKQCHAMVEASRVYCQTSKSFVNGLRELGHHYSGDAMMEVGGLHTHACFLLSNKTGAKAPLSCCVHKHANVTCPAGLFGEVLQNALCHLGRTGGESA